MQCSGVRNFIYFQSIYYKVNRYLARYSPRATTTNQPTNRATNEPERSNHILGQKWPFSVQTIQFNTRAKRIGLKGLCAESTWANTQENSFWLPHSDHIHMYMWHPYPDQEWGIIGQATLLHSWHWVFFRIFLKGICLSRIEVIRVGATWFVWEMFW